MTIAMTVVVIVAANGPAAKAEPIRVGCDKQLFIGPWADDGRDAYLVETGLLHVTFPWEDFYAGVFITTPTVDPLNMNATIAATCGP